MIPILFDKNETIFTSNGIGRLVDCISCTVTEERNGIYEVEFRYPITGKWYNEMITNGGIIGVIHDDNHDIQPFDIYQSSAPIDGIVTFNAHHISYRLNNIILKPFTASSASAAIAAIPSKSVNTNPFSFSTDKTVSATFQLKHPSSVRSILFGEEGSLLDVFGTAEFKFDKWNVEMLAHRGSDTGVTVRFGKNMTQMDWNIDDSGTFNAIAPYWTDGTNYVYPTAIIVQPTTAINPVKPVAMDFSDKFEQQPTKNQVTNTARKYLDTYKPWNRDDNIKLNFIAMWQSPEYADVASIQRVGLCDTVSVYYTDMGLVAEKKKVVRVVFDVLTERFQEMELGSLSNSYVAIENGAGQSGSSMSGQDFNYLESAFGSCISGKKISIIGDSISTFDLDGYKTAGYAQYYPNANVPDVTSVNQTWWKRVLDASGCDMEVNASYSGSTAAKYDTKPSFYERCGSNVIGNPDTILVALGTNDSNNSISIGNFDFTTTYTSLSETTFATAYIKGVKALQNNFPNAQIICVALNMGGTYRNAIVRIATYLGCKYVTSHDYEKGDGSHPNAHGMRQIASAVLALQTTDSSFTTEVVPTQYIENGTIYLNDDSYTFGVAPSANITSNGVNWKDLQNETVAFIRHYIRTSGEYRVLAQVSGKSGNNTINHYIYIAVDGNGNPYVSSSHPVAWRRALNLNYAVNDTFTPENTFSAYGYVTSSTKNIHFNFPVEKSMEDITTITVTALTGAIRGASGYVDSSGTDWTSGYTVTADKVSNNIVHVLISKSTAFSNVTNNTPVVGNFQIALKFT